MGAPVDELGGYAAMSDLTAHFLDMVPKSRLAQSCDRLFEGAQGDEIAIYVDVLGSSLAAAIAAHRAAPAPEAAATLDAISTMLLAVVRALEHTRAPDEYDDGPTLVQGDAARAFLRAAAKLSAVYLDSPFRRPSALRERLLREAAALLAWQRPRTYGALARVIVTSGFPSLRGLSVRELVRRFVEGAPGFNFALESTDAQSVAAHALDLAGVPPAVVTNLLDAAEAMSTLRKERKAAGVPAAGGAKRTRRKKSTAQLTPDPVSHRLDQGAAAVHVRDMTEPRPGLTRHQLREVGVRAGCDPRSVSAYLEGRPQHSTTQARIREALRALGIPDPKAPAGAPPAS